MSSVELLIIGWASIANNHLESSDNIIINIKKFYDNVEAFVDAREYLAGLPTGEQKLLADTMGLVGLKILSLDEKILRDRRNIIRNKMSRLFGELGNTLYGERFRNRLMDVEGGQSIWSYG